MPKKERFLAWIIPVSKGAGDAHPEHPIVIPPGLPGDAHPEHPIYFPPAGSGGEHPEHPIYWPPHPEHPIELPDEGTEPPTDPNAPRPEHPIVIPPDANAPRPEHPIVIPMPKPPDPGDHPSQPIELPPGTYCVQVPVDAGDGNPYWEWVCFVPGGRPPEEGSGPKRNR